MVLSGMSGLAQLRDNVVVMKDYRPLDETEQTAVAEVCRVLRPKGLIPCTACNGKAHECIGCGKCKTACPQHLPIRRYLKDAAKEFEKK